ncbi:MAG: HEPN/Toprim-associated domain-containing protein, partial [Actinomycetota bacterium]|nr:HEPN/Toprim-associated domain-containing protein [Actinomycetota bacterium]
MKSLVDPAVMTMFGGNDRRIYVRQRLDADFGEDEEETAYEYRSTARLVAERLDVMGFTLRGAEERFAQEAKYEAEAEERWCEMLLQQRGEGEAGADGQVPIGATKYSEFLRGLKFDAWIEDVREVFGRLLDGPGGEEQEAELMDRALALLKEDYGFGDDYLFGFPNATEVDIRIVVRALLEAAGPDAEVVLDYTHLVGGGWYSEDDDVRELALQ